MSGGEVATHASGIMRQMQHAIIETTLLARGIPAPGCDSPHVTLDRSKLWTGDLNAKALEPQPP